MSADADLRTYYAQRAAEYERIYAKPERQADLAVLRERVSGLFVGARVLEIACGTGYWTPRIARRAAAVLALDANEAVLEIARAKPPAGTAVRYAIGDAYALPDEAQDCDACFAGFWWSHVPKARRAGFLAGLHARLAPAARVVFLDNRYVEGSSTPVSRTDGAGASFQ
ncbi:MAG: class I SAM-dependent methyltransferase, partial [Proteobacteria bacterium]|nr:class I SAM-dependent methyltransferase [Pseudomonadota bacterium]